MFYKIDIGIKCAKGLLCSCKLSKVACFEIADLYHETLLATTAYYITTLRPVYAQALNRLAVQFYLEFFHIFFQNFLHQGPILYNFLRT